MADSRMSQSAGSARRLGAHHFAHLRAVADGLPVHESAKRYLGVDHKAAAMSAHHQVIDQLRSLARRRGDRRWRLIGMVITTPAGLGVDKAPSVDEWAEERGLSDWSQSELLVMYAEAFPPDRKLERSHRLRARVREALLELQAAAMELPQPSDPLAGWFDELATQRMRAAGLLTLADLRSLVDRGGRWWRAMPSVGEAKAARMAAFLDQLLPAVKSGPGVVERVGRELQLARRQAPSPLALPASGSNRAAPSPAGTTAQTDAEAIEAWVAARAGSLPTAKSYRREAERLLLWAMAERQKPISSMNMDDCLAYMSFLEHIPQPWISRRRAERLEPGWAPFAGQLSHASRRQAVTVVASLFEWLVAAGYLRGNPWRLVNRHTGDDSGRNELDTRAFTPEAWAALLGFVEAQAPSPARSRTHFLLQFLEATGLRAAELLGARMGDLRRVRGRWALQVHGKGSRNRVVAVPRQALEALETYLDSRSLPGVGHAPPETPVLASIPDPMEPIGYQALYESTKAWFRRGIRASELPASEKADALRGSLHWLRHTCGTRALERGAGLDVVQGQLGHRDPRTTMKYAQPQLERMQDEMDKAFG